MRYVRWDGDTLTYLLLAGLLLAVGGYYAATDQASAIHVAALAELVAGAYVLVLAIVPDLRGRGGVRRRALAGILCWTIIAVGMLALWRLGV